MRKKSMKKMIPTMKKQMILSSKFFPKNLKEAS